MAATHDLAQVNVMRLRAALDDYVYRSAHGPTPVAFGVRTPFPPPDAASTPTVRDDDVCWG